MNKIDKLWDFHIDGLAIDGILAGDLVIGGKGRHIIFCCFRPRPFRALGEGRLPGRSLVPLPSPFIFGFTR